MTKTERAIEDLTATVEQGVRHRTPFRASNGRAKPLRHCRSARYEREGLRTMCEALRALRIVQALKPNKKAMKSRLQALTKASREEALAALESSGATLCHTPEYVEEDGTRYYCNCNNLNEPITRMCPVHDA